MYGRQIKQCNLDTLAVCPRQAVEIWLKAEVEEKSFQRFCDAVRELRIPGISLMQAARDRIYIISMTELDTKILQDLAKKHLEYY